MNDQQYGLPVAPSLLNLDLQLLHRLNNSLARMGDVYLSHGFSHKGCLTSADADAKLAVSIPTAGAQRGRYLKTRAQAADTRLSKARQGLDSCRMPS